MNKILGRISLLMFLVFPMLSVAATQINVRVDRNPVSVDESFQLIFEADGSVDDDPDFSPLRQYLDVLNQSESSQISIINGDYKRSKTWTLSVMAKQEGTLTIPPVQFGDDQSQSLTIKVVPPNTVTTSQNQSFFVELSSDSAEVYEQGQIVVTIRVFSDKSLNQIELSSMQFNHSDVIMESLGDETSYQTQINGKAYLVVEKKIALFSQKAGELSIQPIIANATVNGRARSLFDNFNQKTIRARSNGLTVNVLDKKTDYPIWLPTKSVSLMQQWSTDPSQFKVGEPITRTISLVAQGLTAAQLPELAQQTITGVKTYPDQAKLNNTTSSVGITGSRVEKIAYIPESQGKLELPEIQIPWWNIQTHQWQMARLPKQIIQVLANPALAQPKNIQPIQTPEPIRQPVTTDQVEVKSSQNADASVQSSNNYWKILSMILAFLWLITLFLWLKKPKVKDDKQPPKQSKQTVYNLKQLKKACLAEDVQQCKNELILWGKSVWNEQAINNLSSIASQVDSPLKDLINQLQNQLYSDDNQQNMDFLELYSQVKRYQPKKEDPKKQSSFEHLNLAD